MAGLLGNLFQTGLLAAGAGLMGTPQFALQVQERQRQTRLANAEAARKEADKTTQAMLQDIKLRQSLAATQSAELQVKELQLTLDNMRAKAVRDAESHKSKLEDTAADNARADRTEDRLQRESGTRIERRTALTEQGKARIDQGDQRLANQTRGLDIQEAGLFGSSKESLAQIQADRQAAQEAAEAGLESAEQFESALMGIGDISEEVAAEQAATYRGVIPEILQMKTELQRQLQDPRAVTWTITGTDDQDQPLPITTRQQFNQHLLEDLAPVLSELPDAQRSAALQQYLQLIERFLAPEWARFEARAKRLRK